MSIQTGVKNKEFQFVHGYKVEKTAKRLKHAFAKELAVLDVNITVDQWIIIEQLAKEDGVNQLELSKLVYKDAPTITRIIDLLSKKRVVIRVMNTQDRRKFNIKLTAIGRTKFKIINEIAVEFRNKIYEGLIKEDIRKLDYILNTINTNIE